MNKVLIAIIVVAAAGGLLYINSSRSQSPDTTQSGNATSTAQTSGKGGAFTGTLAELVAQSGSLACSFSQTDSGTTVSGTTYIANGHFRTDYSATISAINQNFTGHMIYDGQTAYTWMSILAQGFKTKAPSIADLSKNSGKNSSQSFDMTKSNLYSCKPWSVDASYFVPPTSIQFTDFSLPLKTK